LSIVCSLTAKRSLASSKAAAPDERPASQKRVVVGVVRQTKSTFLKAWAIVLFTCLACYPTRALTNLLVYARLGFFRPVYQASVPYRIKESTHVTTVLRSTDAGGLWTVRARP
jgi:hypothetical protein